jgi:hypothetical protein
MSRTLGAVVTINGQSFTIAGTFAGDLGVGGLDSVGRSGAGAIVWTTMAVWARHKLANLSLPSVGCFP